MQVSFRQRSQDLQLSKTEWRTAQVSTERPHPTSSYVAAPTIVAISFTATTSSHGPYLTYRDDAPCGGWRDVHNCSEYVTEIVRFGKPVQAHGSADMPVWRPIFGLRDNSNEVAVRRRIKNLREYLATLQEKS